MIAHVAEAGEARGRVIVRTTSARASDIAIQAAVLIAQAYRSEIESLYIEDTELIASARFSFVREISPTGSRKAADAHRCHSRSALSVQGAAAAASGAGRSRCRACARTLRA